jgi:hypothetical protein
MTDDLTRSGAVQLAQASGGAIPIQDVVVVTQPSNGGEIVLPSPANRVYDLRFDPRLAKVRVFDADGDGDLDLVMRFNAGTPEESRIVFVDMFEATQSGLAPMMRVGEEQFGADIVVQKAQALAGEQPTLETAAPSGPEAIGTGATQYVDDLGNLIDLLDAQDVILGVEMAFPLIEPDETEEDEDSAAGLGLTVVGDDPDTGDVPEASIVGAPLVAESEFAEFTIELSNQSDFDSTLNVTVSDSGSGIGFATGGTGEPADYLNTSLEFFDGTSWVPFANGSSVTVPAGDTSLQVRVTTLDDAGNPIFEGPEAFQIALSDAGDPGVTVNATPATGTINDDDSVTGGDPDTGDVPDVTIGDASADEGERLVFTVTLSNSSFEAITLALSTAGSGVNSATDGIDYENVNFEVSTNGVDWVAAGGADVTEITFAPAATLLFVRIDSFIDDLNEMDETFTLSATATSGTIGKVTNGTGTIIDTTPILVVGTEADDAGTTGPTHTVPNPALGAPNQGAIIGGGGGDVLIGDPGGAEVFGQFNVAVVVDVTGSIGPVDIVTLNAAVEILVQRIIDEDIADKTVIRLITFAVRSGQTTSGLESGKTFTWDGTQFVATDGEALADAIDEEVADPDGSTDFEPPLQDAADFFNDLNGGTGPAEDDVNRIFFLSDGQDNSGPGGSFDPDNVPDLYGPTGLIAQENLEIRVFGIVSSGGVNSGFDPDQLNLLDDGLPPQPGEPLHEGDDPPVDQVEADIAVIGFDDLDSALTDELLASLLQEVGSDVMSGGDGNDVIFGDVANTGALALAEGIDLPHGSGWSVFEALEAGQSISSPDWDRGDTIAYLRDSANQSDLIGAGRGEADTIDAGAGDDVIFGQGGNDSLTGGLGADTLVYTLAADEGDDEILDFSTAEGDLLAFVNVVNADLSGTIGIDDVVDSFVDGGGAGAIDTLMLGSGTTIMITDLDGTLTDLESLEANALINGTIA